MPLPTHLWCRWQGRTFVRAVASRWWAVARWWQRSSRSTDPAASLVSGSKTCRHQYLAQTQCLRFGSTGPVKVNQFNTSFFFYLAQTQCLRFGSTGPVKVRQINPSFFYLAQTQCLQFGSTGPVKINQINTIFFHLDYMKPRIDSNAILLSENYTKKNKIHK